MRKTLAVFAAACFLGLAGIAALFAAKPVGPENVSARDIRPVWTEVRWPFPIDQWGTGKAFVCKPADCGTAVTLYLRAKIGFCNCTTGVADDEELERIGDLELVGRNFSPSGPGHAITVAWMKGRSRAYDVETAHRSTAAVRTIAFNDRCDAIVATAVMDGHQQPTIEPKVLEFLNSSTVLRWAELTLGL